MKKLISSFLCMTLLFPLGILLVSCGSDGISREELKAELKNELKDELREEIRAELKGELENELREEIAASRLTNEELEARVAYRVNAELDRRAEENESWLVATDYVIADGKTDCSAFLQKLIDDNPRRTIYFPDGEYLLNAPIQTSSDPMKSVDLRLSNYAILRANPHAWGDQGEMVLLGAKDGVNNVVNTGSNYSLTGGILDGAGVAGGACIAGGRETKIRDVSIKNTTVGIRIAYGANSGSADADISDVNIIGNRKKEAVGIVVDGYDNTFTNVRIGGVGTGVILNGGGNSLRNVHPLFNADWSAYEESVAFVDNTNNNTYYYCYSDQFATGFYFKNGNKSILDSCFIYWWTDRGGVETAFRTDGKFRAVINDASVNFHSTTTNTVLALGASGGTGIINNLRMNPNLVSNEDDAYKLYFHGYIVS